MADKKFVFTSESSSAFFFALRYWVLLSCKLFTKAFLLLKNNKQDLKAKELENEVNRQNADRNKIIVYIALGAT
ncbi:MAG: hypothetical protein AAFU57_10575, partial [Bacteroidota bacterium]